MVRINKSSRMKSRKNKDMPRDLVILLHGIMRSKADMLPLTALLRAQGYDAVNILYPSRTKSLEEITDFVHEKITKSKKYSPDKVMHFVTHSMGGIIARYYIATRRPAHLGRVVMLGPPNTGSEFADFMNENKILGPVFKAVFGPAGQQLVTGYKHIDTAIDYPLGVIAGNASINPLAPWVLDGEHDGIVPVERTRIEGMADHIVLHTSHSLMMFNPGVMAQVVTFLDKGKFKR